MEIRDDRVIRVSRGKSKAQYARMEVDCNSAMTNETLKSDTNGNIRRMKSLRQGNYFRAHSSLRSKVAAGGRGRGREGGREGERRRRDEESTRGRNFPAKI